MLKLSDFEVKTNILISFYYFNPKFIQIIKRLSPRNYRFIVDSGAFSAWSLGASIDMSKYIRFIELLKQLPHEIIFINLDKVRDNEQSLKNYRIMKKEGADVCGVIQCQSTINIDEFQEYEETSKVVFIGGSMGTPRHKWYAFLDKIHEIKKSDTKLHLLGDTSNKSIIRYNPYSVDASSAAGAGKFGFASIMKKETCIIINHQKEYFLNLKNISEIKKNLSAYGCIDFLDELKKENNWSAVGGLNRRYCINTLSYLSYLMRSTLIKNKFGTNCYLATVSADHMLSTVLARKTLIQLKQDGKIAF